MKVIFLNIKKGFLRWQAQLTVLLASAIISLSWNWYFVKNHFDYGFSKKVLLGMLIIFATQRIAKKIYLVIIRRLSQRRYWQEEFNRNLDTVFLIFSSFFLAAFSRNELFSLLLISGILALLYWRLNYYFSHHPNGKAWQAVNNGIWLLGSFLFFTSAIFQFYAFKTYILETALGENGHYSAVMLRSLAMTIFWLAGFSVCGIIHGLFRKKIKYLFIALWSLLFIFVQLVWALNVGLLYFSGIYLSPIMLSHAKGSAGLFWNQFVLWLIALYGLLIYAFFKIISRIKILGKGTPKKYWYSYGLAIIVLAMLSFTILPFYKNTPEYLMAKSFYNYYTKADQTKTIDPLILKKLTNFGLFYDYDNKFIAYKTRVFSGNKNYLPAKFAAKKPNVIIVFFESFSARLTGAYDKNLTALTPGLAAMSEDKNTTIFKKYYNAATPTITGLIAQLCSFLPPTGQDEIKKKNTGRYNLPCLPEILKKYGGYNYTNYVTAVKKNFARKGEIVTDMGTDELYGTDELAKLIAGKPLSWGYSDHQMFPVFFDMAETSPAPFLIMLSTVDTHPPYNLAKDVVPYGDGKNDLLNGIHTTDDAFLKFWEKFKASNLYNNTVLIAVADHAIFPAAYAGDNGKKFLKPTEGKITFYDETMFMIYLPDTTLPKEIDLFSSSIDFAPTILQILNINAPNFFEGLSILENRKKFPNLLGMNEYEIYINQAAPGGERNIQFGPPANIKYIKPSGDNARLLTLYEYLQYYNWKKEIFNGK